MYKKICLNIALLFMVVLTSCAGLSPAYEEPAYEEITISSALSKAFEIDEHFLTTEDTGVIEITKKENGSYTYLITKTLQEDLLSTIETRLENLISELGSTDGKYPAYTSAKANKDFTVLTVFVDSEIFEEDLDIDPVYSLAMTCDLHQALSGSKENDVNTSVVFEDDATKDILSTISSKDFYGK